MAKKNKGESAINAQVTELTAEQLESLPGVDNTTKDEGTEVEFIMDDSEEEDESAIDQVQLNADPVANRERTVLESECYKYLKSLTLHDFALHSKFGEAEALLKKF